MSAKTISALQMSAVLDSDNGPHLRITYDDATTDDITLGASGGTRYWVLSNGGIDDLLAVLEAALTSGASGTWTVSLVTAQPWGRVLISQGVSPPKAAASIEWLTDELTPRDLGLAASGTTTTNLSTVLGVRLLNGAYRARWIYSPDVITTADDPDTIHEIVQVDLPSGPVVTDDYGGRTVRSVLIPFVQAGMVKAEYTADSSYNANLDSISSADPNGALDAWLEALRTRLNGPTPTLRWHIDRSSGSTYKVVKLGDGALYGSTAAWGEKTQDSPLQYHLRFDLVEAS